MRTFTAVLAGKILQNILRLSKLSGGHTAPGLCALKIDPDLVTKLASKIPKNIIITGTNGKTTTSRMIAHIAKNAGLKVMRNHTGSNLERGIASTLIDGVKLSHPWGDTGSHLGIWEVDEAAFNSVVFKIKPQIIVFLNAFRDQLDRYGEVDSVIKNWMQTLKNLPKETIILLNGDDANVFKLKDFFKGKAYTFGAKDFKIKGESTNKGLSKLDFEAKNVKQKGLHGSTFQLSINNELLTINLPVPGLYHTYDALAALASSEILGLSLNKSINFLKTFKPAFGRVEKLPFGYMFLIKNPAGANQVFETLAPNVKKEDRLFLALNDNLADGTDVSWIWDVNFEKLFQPKIMGKSRGVNTIPPPRWDIVVSGTRAHDLALRLKYAGFDTKSIIIESNLKKALQQARKGLKGSLYILPTYTAMLSLQKILTKQGIKKHYWEEK